MLHYVLVDTSVVKPGFASHTLYHFTTTQAAALIVYIFFLLSYLFLFPIWINAEREKCNPFDFRGIESDYFAFSLDQNLLLMGSCQNKLRQQKRLQLNNTQSLLLTLYRTFQKRRLAITNSTSFCYWQTSGNSKFAEFCYWQTAGNSKFAVFCSGQTSGNSHSFFFFFFFFFLFIFPGIIEPILIRWEIEFHIS